VNWQSTPNGLWNAMTNLKRGVKGGGYKKGSAEHTAEPHVKNAF
jgi:hypothetical protein